MIRLNFGRAAALALTSGLCLFVFGVGTASATHFRYGTIHWEKVLTHTVPTEYKATVTFEVALRWSFAYGGSTAGRCALYPGYVDNGNGSCPDVGAVLNLGSVAFNKAVKINTATATTTSLTYNAFVTAFDPSADLVYTTFTFDITFPTVSNPVTVSWDSSARLSTILEGNNDIPWRLQTIVDAAFPSTKSPLVTSLPIIPVTTGVVNNVVIPSVAFDNTTSRWRFATSSESQLVKTVPTGMTLDPAGFVQFTPPQNGLYAVQFMVTAVDSNGIARNAVPLDVLFQADAGSSNVAALTMASGTIELLAGQTYTFPVRATLTPADAAFSKVSITSTPLNPRMSFSAPAGGTGAAQVTGTLLYSPNLGNSGQVTTMCFQAIYQKLTTPTATVSSPSGCFTLRVLGNKPPETSQCSAPQTVPAVDANGAMATVSLKVSDPEQNAMTVLWSVDGTPLTPTVSIPSGTVSAPVELTRLFPIGVHQVSAIAFDMFGNSSCTMSVTIAKRTQTVSLDPVATMVFGAPPVMLHASASSGLPVTLSVLSGPGALNGNLLSATASSGVIRVQASQPGDAVYAAASPVAVIDIRVDSPVTSIALDPKTAVSDQPTTLTARLLNSLGMGIPGQIITFSIVGGLTIDHATTDANGDATVNWTPPSAFSGGLRAVFTGGPSGYSPSSATAPLSIERASTGLSSLVVPAFVAVGDMLTVSTVLTRLVTPTGPIGGVPIQFTLTGPGGTPLNLTSMTDGNGLASITFAPLTVRGAYTVQAIFAGTPDLTPAMSGSTTFNVYQRTTLSVSPASGPVGAMTEISAQLLSVPGGMPLVGQTVSFSFTGSPTPPTASGTTDSQGRASVLVNFPAVGTFQVTASFANLAGFFVDSSGASLPTTAVANVVIGQAGTNLRALSPPPPRFVGDTLSVSTVLTRTTAPAGPVSGASVRFTLTGPNGPTIVMTSTAADGSASASLPLSVRGFHTISADFSGTPALATASTGVVPFTVSQKTQLVFAPVSGPAGAPLALTATLLGVPGGAPVAGENVRFDFSGVIPAQTVPTGATGAATATVTFPTAGTFTATATFANAAGFFEASSAAALVTAFTAPTTLSPPVVPSSVPLGSPIAVSSTLGRGDAVPVGAGLTVVFTVSGPSGPITQTGTTNATGTASASFAPLPVGPYSLKASFVGNGALGGSTSPTVPFSVVQLPSAATSTISGTTPVTADGTAASTITITVKDAGGTPMSGLQPTFAATGSNNVLGPCTPTDASGASTCSLRSTTAEVKTLSILTPVAKTGGTVTFTSAGPSAIFVKSDVSTQGNWKGVYGSQGAGLVNDVVNYPTYAQVTPSTTVTWTWAGTTTDGRALQRAASGRIAACWCNTTFDFDVNLTDGAEHQLALYGVDWDTRGRVERVDVLSAGTTTVLDTRTLTGFSGGQYLVWLLRGHVTIRVTLIGGPNAVVSGLFFDPGSTGGPTVTTGTATGLTATGATLGGTVNPNAVATTASFEYGPTTSYGSASGTVNVGAGSSPVPVTVPIAGLSCNTPYHFRAIGQSSAGTSFGSDAMFTTAPCPGGASALFVRTDTATLGSWKGVYGSEGAGLVNDTLNFPTYAQVTPGGATMWTWASTSTELRAAQRVISGRIAACWCASTFTFDVNLTDGVPHQLALYAVDWDNRSRVERVDVLAAGTTTVLDSRTLTGFGGGQYLVWMLSGHVTIRITAIGGPNAVVSGLFFDAGAGSATAPTVATGAATGVTTAAATLDGTVNPNSVAAMAYFQYGPTLGYGSTSTPVNVGAGASDVPVTAALNGLSCNTPYHFRVVGESSAGTTYGLDGTFTTAPCPGGPSVQFVRSDTGTSGNWKGVYGSQGAGLVNDSLNYPAYAQVTPAGHTTWTWASSTTDARALQRAASGRIAACWCASTFTFDVNLTDGQPHQVALYGLDWDNLGRVERIDILAAGTNTVLDTRTLASFSGGQYLVWTVSGHVTIRVTVIGGPNAVVSGLFFGPNLAPVAVTQVSGAAGNEQVTPAP